MWKLYSKNDGKLRPTPLRNDLRAPLDRWMASRLVRLFPVVVALYEKVKAATGSSTSSTCSSSCATSS